MWNTRSIITLASLIATGSCGPALSMDVSGPATVTGIENMKVIVTLTNTGNETLKLLNDPRGPLSLMATNTFLILHESGSGPVFNGLRAKYVPDKVAGMDNDALFTVLEPGKSVSVEHDLSAAYDFTESGEGPYGIGARNIFHYVDAANKTVVIEAESTQHNITSLTGNLAVTQPNIGAPVSYTEHSGPGGHLSKRTKFSECSHDQVQQISKAIPAAQNYTTETIEYLKANPGSTDRYKTWFGEQNQSRRDTVTSHYTKLSQNDFSIYTYKCTCDEAGVFAFVRSNEFGIVTFCGAFWDAPVVGTDSKAGTIVHEASHFNNNGGTDDHAYGPDKCQALAKNKPDQATDNADTHEYFVENNPSLA